MLYVAPNIPIIDDDDETNVDDDEDFFPAYLRSKLNGTPVRELVYAISSTYKVFAVEGSNRQSGQKSKRVFAIGGDDVDSESTDPVSLEDQDEDDANDDTLITSTASTPSDERELMPPGTPDKPLRKGKSEMARAMDETRRRLADVAPVPKISTLTRVPKASTRPIFPKTT
nr:hypothetical protein BaRGS_014175 [Batillaria attramentaria]